MNCFNLKATDEALFIELLVKSNPSLCIYIGANIGGYSEILLNRINTQVIAFEPLPKAFKMLSKLNQSFPNRIEAINAGVGSKEEILELHYGSEDSVFVSFSSEVKQIDYVGASNTNVMKAPVITLDSYYKKHIKGNFDSLDLLKIDTEGFEYAVLVGANQTISELKPKFIQTEYNWHQLVRAQSLKNLSELMPGYSAYQLPPYGSGLIKRDINRPEANIYHYSNFVFVRDDIAPRCSGPLILDTFQATFSNSAIF
ncbi:MAG: FkbM family methyltransferase [Gammaproteobacteria bacterium]|nr:FkbM family methyltransferase [Gammaproteobacteria bacterium]